MATAAKRMSCSLLLVGDEERAVRFINSCALLMPIYASVVHMTDFNYRGRPRDSHVLSLACIRSACPVDASELGTQLASYFAVRTAVPSCVKRTPAHPPAT